MASDLDELRHLSALAWPGPWMHSEAAGAVVAVMKEGTYGVVDTRHSRHADAAFIAASRNAVPDLLAELTSLRARVAAVRALCDATPTMRGFNGVSLGMVSVDAILAALGGDPT